MKKREFKIQPYCWQSKRALELIVRKSESSRETIVLTVIYVALTRIASDRETNSPTVFYEDIAHYSNLDRKTVYRKVPRLEKFGLISILPYTRKSDGKFPPRQVILTDVQDEPYTPKSHIMNIYNTNSIEEENPKKEREESGDPIVNTPTQAIEETGENGNRRPAVSPSQNPSDPSSQNNAETNTATPRPRTKTTKPSHAVTPEEIATLTPTQKVVYDRMTKYSTVKVDSFRKWFPVWTKNAGVDELLKELDRWELYHEEKSGGIKQPLTSFTNWMSNFKPRGNSGFRNNDVSVQIRPDVYPFKTCWEVTDYKLASDFHKELIMNGIKAGECPKDWRPPLNTPDRYVKIFQDMKR